MITTALNDNQVALLASRGTADPSWDHIPALLKSLNGSEEGAFFIGTVYADTVHVKV